MKAAFVLLVASVAVMTLAGTSTNAPLTLVISIPVREGDYHSLQPRRSSTFYVILSNTSNVPQRVWAPWGNLKHVPLHFEIQDSKGKQWKATPNISYGVSQRLPETSELRSGESLVFDIDYSNTNAWNDFPRAAPPEFPLSMRAVYDNRSGQSPEGQPMWTGSVSSKTISVIIRPP